MTPPVPLRRSALGSDGAGREDHRRNHGPPRILEDRPGDAALRSSPHRDRRRLLLRALLPDSYQKMAEDGLAIDAWLAHTHHWLDGDPGEMTRVRWRLGPGDRSHQDRPVGYCRQGEGSPGGLPVRRRDGKHDAVCDRHDLLRERYSNGTWATSTRNSIEASQGSSSAPRTTPERDIKLIACTREHIGDDAHLMADGYWTYTSAAAIRLANQMAEYNVSFYDEAIPQVHA